MDENTRFIGASRSIPGLYPKKAFYPADYLKLWSWHVSHGMSRRVSWGYCHDSALTCHGTTRTLPSWHALDRVMRVSRDDGNDSYGRVLSVRHDCVFHDTVTESWWPVCQWHSHHDTVMTCHAIQFTKSWQRHDRVLLLRQESSVMIIMSWRTAVGAVMMAVSRHGHDCLTTGFLYVCHDSVLTVFRYAHDT